MIHNNIHSKYTFQGKLVGVRQLVYDWGLIEMSTGKILVAGSNEQILHLYDKVNNLDSIPSTETLLEWGREV